MRGALIQVYKITRGIDKVDSQILFPRLEVTIAVSLPLPLSPCLSSTASLSLPLSPASLPLSLSLVSLPRLSPRLSPPASLPVPLSPISLPLSLSPVSLPLSLSPCLSPSASIPRSLSPPLSLSLSIALSHFLSPCLSVSLLLSLSLHCHAPSLPVTFSLLITRLPRLPLSPCFSLSSVYVSPLSLPSYLSLPLSLFHAPCVSRSHPSVSLPPSVSLLTLFTSLSPLSLSPVSLPVSLSPCLSPHLSPRLSPPVSLPLLLPCLSLVSLLLSLFH